MAAFEVATYGRFWVAAEGNLADCGSFAVGLSTCGWQCVMGGKSQMEVLESEVIHDLATDLGLNPDKNTITDLIEALQAEEEDDDQE